MFITKIAKRTLQTLAIPAGVIVVILIICSANGVSLFSTSDSPLIFLRGTVTVMLTTMALSINLSSGRFDFSLGSIATLSAVMSTQICIANGFDNTVMLILSLFFGSLLGGISGLLYVFLRIPPIIASLGVTLLYEGISFALTEGANVSFVLNNSLISFSKEPVNMVIIIVIVLALMIFIFDFTKFGYNYKSLISGQKVAVNTGIKEVPNTIICYTLSGALISVVGFITASQMGYIEAGNLNFGSIAIMFTAFLPMFIGGFIGRFSNDKLGYLLGAITVTIIGMSYSALNLQTSTQSIFTAVMLVLFLIYLNNENKVVEIVTLKKILKRKGKAA